MGNTAGRPSRIQSTDMPHTTTQRLGFLYAAALVATAAVLAFAAPACGTAVQGASSPDSPGRHLWAAGLEQVPWDVRVEESAGHPEPPQILIKRSPEDLAALLSNYRLYDYEFRKAIVDPRFIAAEQASGRFANRQVLGVSIDGDHRAYAIHFIEAHEIVNDTVGGVPVAVTY